MPDTITENITQHLAKLAKESQRNLHNTQILPGGRLLRHGREYTDFASNDYLGLAHHPALKRKSIECIEQFGNGSGASRLVSGNTPFFQKIEKKIAELKGSETSLVMNSGFQANSSVLSCLLDLKSQSDKPTLIFTDKLNHASLHMGIRLSGIKQIRYRHNDLEHLGELLDKHSAESHPNFIITESVFSMDGDILDIEKISHLARMYNSFLYIDEAHTTGVMGPNGAGLCKGGDVSLIMGTFGKAMGSFGAYIACNHHIKDYLVNHCPGLIYATALPPSVLGAIDAALDLLPDLKNERDTLNNHSKKLREALKQMGFDTRNSSTHIIPIIIGRDEDVLHAGDILEKNGIICGVIRPPTVPKKTARLRICLSAAHSQSQIDQLLTTLENVKNEIKA